MSDQRQARRACEKVDTYTVKFTFPSRTTCFPDVAGGLHGARRPGPSGAHGHGCVCAGPLPEAVPPEVRRQGRARQEGRRTPSSTTGSACSSIKNDWALNPELPVLTPWKTVTPINTPTWTLERNPYSVWVDTDGNQLPYIDKIQSDPGREPGGAQPARHRRRVRLPGAPHRPRQAAGLPGEPAEGQLQGVSRPRRLRRRRASSSST